MSLFRDTRHKQELALAEHVKKAVNAVETAPKQKHVRKCILFCWEYQTSVPFWGCLKMQQVMSDQIPCFKALMTIHKLLVGGPHVILSEALNERGFLENCVRLCVTTGYGYGPLIKAYTHFLLSKLDFHQLHPVFSGNFDYEEYIAAKGVEDLDQGYQTISDLQDLLDKLEDLHRIVFNNFRSSDHNECRIASLVPVIEESYGIYKFITSMLSAMHALVDSPDPLVLLVERYASQFRSLKRFYEECSKIRYLTSLINIPKLPEQPPFFTPASTAIRPEPKVAKERRTQPPPTLEKDQESIGSHEDLMGGHNQQQHNQQQHVEVYHETYSSMYPPQPQMALPQPVMAPQIAYQQPQQIAYDPYAQQQQQQQQQQQHHSQQLQQRTEILEQEVTRLTQTLRITQEELKGAHEEASKSGNQLYTIQNTTDMQLKLLQDQVNQWKSKYEGMVKMYQQLRVEHVDLLKRFSDQNDEVEALRNGAQSTEELSELLGQRDSLASQLQASLGELEAARLEDAQALNDKDVDNQRLLEEVSSRDARIEELYVLVEQLEQEKSTHAQDQVTYGDRLEEELAKAAREIAEAAEKFANLAPSDTTRFSAAQLAVHEAIRGATQAVTGAIGDLIHWATLVQAEIVAHGRGSGSPEAFYRQHSVWTKGLISAAQAVANATLDLVEVADGVLRGDSSLEELVVTSGNVSAAVAQLLAAARVKALPGSDNQAGLEASARAVGECNRALVSATNIEEALTSSLEHLTLDTTDPHSIKVLEVEQQVRIKRLERELEQARLGLGQLRRQAYAPASATGSTNNDDIEKTVIAATLQPGQ